MPLTLTAATVLAALVLAGLAAYVGRRRGSRAGLSLSVLLVAGAWWAAAYAVELSTSDLVPRGYWGDLKYVGITLLPPAFLDFVLQYTGRHKWVTRRRLALLAVEPVLVLALLALPMTHDLIRFYLPEATREIPVAESGPLFWVVLGYANALVLVATVIFVASLGPLARVYRVAASALLVSVLLPWAANLLFNFEVAPFNQVDLTPFAFILGSPVLVWGLFRERLINLSSIAWDRVVGTMADPVIVRDAFGRVVDVNPSAAKAFGRARDALIGTEPPELGEPGELGVAMVTPALDLPAPDGDGRRHYEVRRHPLHDAAGDAGDVVVLHDVTDTREAEARLRLLLAERTRIARTLQDSLLPAQLPVIPGCTLEALYAPADDEVAGDFYDVFRVDARTWGIVLADVSGKGSAAAAYTGKVRFTLRTLAAGGSSPRVVLKALNAALIRDSVDDRFCTVVFAIATVRGTGLDLRLSLAGHHPPLLRRGSGQVEMVGTLGTALGLVDDPRLTDTFLRVEAGDLLCLFTDGLVEARCGEDEFGDERAMAILAGAGDQPYAVVHALSDAVRRFHPGALRDDLTLLCVGAGGAGGADVPPS
ncbi:MAG: SpoIIE family protein phosphatase [Actinomycetota bacterium]|nr:SpoIIE family protein phosphatase [Actinomycetota bacterium]